ncbi:MAG: Flp pilus assembly protein TadG [Paracoccaceae bacterium]|jgi:Flp pilus assembly protein TadG
MALWRRLIDPFRDRSGSVAIEFVLWMPFFFGLVGLATDASMLVNLQSRMQDAAFVASRAVATAKMTDVEAEQFVRGRFVHGATMGVSVTILDGFVTTEVTAPFSDAMVFGRALVGDSTIRADFVMLVERSAAPEPTGGA